jgi:hypothetical protein
MRPSLLVLKVLMSCIEDNMRALIIGGTRYFGKKLARKLLNEGSDEVRHLICDRHDQQQLAAGCLY